MLQSQLQQFPIHTEILPFQLKQWHLPVNVGDAKEGRYRLRDIRGQCRAHNAQPQACHEDQIEAAVENRGHRQKTDRCPGIPHTPQGGCHRIIQIGKRHSEKYDPQIQHCLPEDLFRYPQSLHHRPRTRQPQKNYDSREETAEDQRSGYLALQLLPASRPEEFTHQNRGSDTDSGYPQNHNTHHGICSPHRRQGILSRPSADDNRVHGIIGQLK